ncbi:hypothetical protein PL9631_710035 [Planktothrix paucivesiculata PCC 9631]|uniref:Uncharacterized protein n=1 Tax=Planktothrix paucivesiculata PCC 9631 TaxID=671071 RepID=A0A7Z9C173_9CYAN|nr:hypothetical protein PL9631_710035 [Planktothrix paucivesiculata PCC 9631]
MGNGEWVILRLRSVTGEWGMGIYSSIVLIIPTIILVSDGNSFLKDSISDQLLIVYLVIFPVFIA